MKSKEKNKFRDVPIFNNIKEVIYNSVKLYRDNIAFVTKIKKENKSVEYINHTYQNFLDDINSFGTALYALGLKGKRVAIVGRNRYEWAVAHISNLFGGIVSVPIDKELQLSELEDSLVRAKVDAIVFDEKYEENIDIIKQNGKTKIKDFICMGNLDNYTKFEELLRNGRNQVLKGNREFINNEVNSEAMSILLFTSGTTSKSKAVMLNQKGLATNIADMLMVESLSNRYKYCLFTIPSYFWFNWNVSYVSIRCKNCISRWIKIYKTKLKRIWSICFCWSTITCK